MTPFLTLGTVDVLCSHEGFIPETGLGFRSFCPALGSIPNGGYFNATAPSLLGRLPRKAHIIQQYNYDPFDH